QPAMPNVVATVEGSGPGRHLVFNGHLDTFPVGDRRQWSVNPFGEVRDGRIYGRGAADMKGGVTASLVAFFLLAERRDQWRGRVTITLVSDEETGGRWGTEYLLTHYPWLRGDAVLNGEPSSPGICFFGEKGQHWYRFRVTTKGGHSAYAYQKQSAIDVLLDLVRALRAFEDLPMSAPPHVVAAMEAAREAYDAARTPGASRAVLQPSCNVGIVRGGTKVNMLAESAEAEVDFRLPPGVDPAVLHTFLDQVLARFPQVEKSLIKETPATLSPIDNPLLRCVRDVGEAVTGRPVYPAVSLGGTDIRFWRLLGVDSAVYGPTHHNMGSPDEYITIEDLMKAAAVHTVAAYRYLRETQDAKEG
ncbi:MAG TPA: M20/M25/M40 family metallo-hydrolase, partial [Limnochordales bacterium]